MATSREVADSALASARQVLAAEHGQLATLAAGDRETLIQAARLVRTNRVGRPERERAAEHIAFALLMAAYNEVTGTAEAEV